MAIKLHKDKHCIIIETAWSIVLYFTSLLAVKTSSKLIQLDIISKSPITYHFTAESKDGRDALYRY